MYVGLAKTHTQHLMEAIAYNLYRTPGITAKNALIERIPRSLLRGGCLYFV